MEALLELLVEVLPNEVPRLDMRALLDILIVAGLIYGLLMMIKDTTAVMLVRGLAILVLGGALLSNLLNLPVLGWLIRSSIPAFIVAIPILFQPELRRALEQIGRVGRLSGHHLSNQDHLIDVIAVAARRLAERRWGALIVIERETALGEYGATGVELDAAISVDIFEQIFHPNTRLHDGAAIIRGDRVLAAGCVLPLTESLGGGQMLGTRHRAAVGITEQADAVVVVVSEETGMISIANNGRLVRNLDEGKLRKVLSILYRPTRSDDTPRWPWNGLRFGGDGTDDVGAPPEGRGNSSIVGAASVALAGAMTWARQRLWRGGAGVR